MLHHLHIKNFALIESLDIDLSERFNVFTGETGAGKTIIINALNLVLGERASSDLIRPGAEKLEVSAVFHSAGEELILKRELTANGKSVCRVNGEIVPLTQLNTLGARLVDLHGQHEHQSLLKTELHIRYLDAFHKNHHLLQSVQQSFLQWKTAEQEWLSLQHGQEEAQSKVDFLKYQLEEIQSAQIEPDEDSLLEQERHRLVHAEKLAGHASRSVEWLDTAEDAFRKGELAEMTAIDPAITQPDEDWNDILYRIEELKKSIHRYQEQIEFNPARQEEVESRLHVLHLLKKKYGASLEAILDKQKSLQAELDAMEWGPEKLEAARAEMEKQKNQFEIASASLSKERKCSAEKMEKALTIQLAELAMEKTVFKAALTSATPSATGVDQAEFLISPNPGQPLRPLAKIASGGEISRIMLALKTVLLKTDITETLIFDEIDSGIGGKTAQSVGEKLRKLSETYQILCITHLPAIAAKAGRHFVVEKQHRAEQTDVQVRPLTAADREHEIARMLSGNVTETTIQHARELLLTSSETPALPEPLRG